MVDNGGDAFPMASVSDCYPGMKLRDWFAGMALNGICSDSNIKIENENRAKFLAFTCYAFADAMIAERKKRRINGN
jgi:hypothetical protein